jgi:hypothetical protein
VTETLYLRLRALHFYPDNRLHGSEGGEGESPFRPLSTAFMERFPSTYLLSVARNGTGASSTRVALLPTRQSPYRRMDKKRLNSTRGRHGAFQFWRLGRDQGVGHSSNSCPRWKPLTH